MALKPTLAAAREMIGTVLEKYEKAGMNDAHASIPIGEWIQVSIAISLVSIAQSLETIAKK